MFKKLLVGFLGLGATVLLGFVVFNTSDGQSVGAIANDRVCVASSTTITVGAEAAKIAIPASGRRCGWEMTAITNGALYGVGFTPTASVGHWFAASSTVRSLVDSRNGDSVSVIGAITTASTSVRVTEYRF